MNDEDKIQFGRDLLDASYAGAARAAEERQAEGDKNTIRSLCAAGTNVLDALRNVEVRGDAVMELLLATSCAALEKTIKATGYKE